MKKILLLALGAAPAAGLCAQRQADNWFFGGNAGLTFDGGVPVIVTGGQLNAQEGCASLSDAEGNLLFYASGSAIWSRDHGMRPNGHALNGSSSCTQAALFTPYPGQDSLFHLFTPPDGHVDSAFCYSLVDLTLNNGYGDVIHKNTPLFRSSTEKVTAVRHGNGNDIWVIGHRSNSADFHAYRITNTGIDTVPVISTVGTSHAGSWLNKIGTMKASPCGDKIALTVFNDAFVELFDFDDQTGVVSNAVHLGDYPPFNPWGLYGLEFSPNGSRLYVTQETPALLVQYNVAAGPPEAIIASADTIYFHPSSMGTLQLAPDKRIYVSRLGTRLGRINEPDLLGAACNFVDSVISLLPFAGSHGLPNFMTSYFCSRPSTVGWSSPGLDDPSFTLGPNPAHEAIVIGFSTTSTTQVDLLDAVGQLILRKTSPPTGARTEVTISLVDLPPGIYFVAIGTEGSRRVERLVKE